MRTVSYVFFVSIFLWSCKSKTKTSNNANEYPQIARQQLVVLNQLYDSALISSDTTLLNKMYAPEFTYTTPEGQVRSKHQQLITIGTGGLKLDYGKSDEVDVKIYDSTAIVTGRFLGKGIFKENIIDVNERYTTVWVKKNGEWRLVKEQGTFIQ